MVFILKHALSVKLLLLLNFTLLFKTVVSSTKYEKNEALVFDRYHDSLIQLPSKIPEETITGPWAIACPLPKSEVGDLMKNALVVKHIYRKGSKASDMERNICEESYTLSVVYDLKRQSFKFGYAIYHEMKDDGYFHRSNEQNFITPNEATKLMKKHPSTDSSKVKIIKDTSQIDNKELWLNGDQRMEFTWIYLFKLRFDFSKKILIKTEYFILHNNRWPAGEQCDDYTMGSEVYEDINIDELYSKNNQSKIFQNIKIPEISQPNRYLSKWLLIPIDQFVFGSSGFQVCSNMATIPIWADTVEKVLTRVDQLLFVVHRVLNEQMVVTSGISEDVFEFPVKTTLGKMFKKKTPLYMYPEKKKIPVPKIIYKMITYRPSTCDHNYSHCFLSVIIVIHNDPFYNKSRDRKLCHEATTFLGWDSLLTDPQGNEFNNIYVCRSELEILTKLMGRFITPQQHLYGVFKLSEIPIYGGAQGRINDYLDIKNDVDIELKKMDKDGMIGDVRNNDITMRMQENDQEDDDDKI